MKEGEGEKEEEKDRPTEKEEGGEASLSAQTAAPRSIFDYHIIETVFTEICVCLSLSLWPHHSSFRLCDISCVAYTAGVKYSCGWEEGVMQDFFFFLRNA